MRDRVVALLYKLMMEHDISPGMIENFIKTAEKEGYKPDFEHKDVQKVAERLAKGLVPPIMRSTEAARIARWKKKIKDHQRCDCADPKCRDCFPPRLEDEPYPDEK
jgi:hypothetical protein